ncbi:hypothetical protein ACIPW5_04460 [Streptomyces sp. NPDC090077]|uniref:hypothetical protein n=1 Tax=Streptomyces sp. NPDC090077 TaxID=3365938 RepID=UPI0037F3557F
MFLICASLTPRPGSSSGPFPGDTAAAVAAASAAAGVRGVEHVVQRARPGARPVLGVYVVATTRQAAASACEQAWRAAVAARPELAGWTAAWEDVPLHEPPVA